jgi:hypothetical protein
MNFRVVIFVVIALCIVGAGAFVWFTWPTEEPEPVVTEPIQEPAPTTKAFASTTLGYSLTYPMQYTESLQNYPFSSTKSIRGVKFTIPASMATGTNLSADSYVSIEQLPNAKLCTGDIYLIANVKAQALTEGSVEYSVASSTGAAAGNRYEEIVYALKGSSPCTAVRYYIHGANVGNYPTGTVQEFNRAALLEQFDQVRRTVQKI